VFLQRLELLTTLVINPYVQVTRPGLKGLDVHIPMLPCMRVLVYTVQLLGHIGDSNVTVVPALTGTSD
jgi:hypothetical protein